MIENAPGDWTDLTVNEESIDGDFDVDISVFWVSNL